MEKEKTEPTSYWDSTLISFPPDKMLTNLLDTYKPNPLPFGFKIVFS